MDLNHPQLQKLPDETKEEIYRLSENIADYTKRTAQKIFDVCWLYIVGSSLISDKPNDIDVVLVGLDFREIFDYGWIYLRNPRTLIDEEIVVPEWHPTAAWWEDEDNTFFYEGKKYRWNSDKSRFRESIATFCDSEIEISSLIKWLHRISGWHKDSVNPIHPYTHRDGNYLVVRQKVWKSIDFLIHGESMLVESWKRNQQTIDLWFFPLHEGDRVDIQTTKDRSQRKFINLPWFIDPLGQKRSKYIPGD